jgi:hypothetical protein
LKDKDDKMSRLEVLADHNYREFLEGGMRVLILTLPECPNCRAWTGELEEFLTSDEDWRQVRFGKLDLEGENVKDFKDSNDWLEFVEGVPFNVIYMNGEPKVSFSGAGVTRMVKRLQRLSSET